MTYDKSDLRSQLQAAPKSSGVNVAPQYFEFGSMAVSDATTGDGRSYLARSQNAVANYIDAADRRAASPRHGCACACS
ncbi:MAG: hypothetical protein AAF829_11115 [Pseudomonadota bacterium]